MSNFKLQILDLGNLSGTPVLTRASIDGGYSGASFATSFYMRPDLDSEAGVAPLVIHGVGPSLGPKYIDFPYLRVRLVGDSQRIITGINDDWGTSPSAALLTAQGLAPASSAEPAFYTGVYPSSTQYAYVYKSLPVVNGELRARTVLIRPTGDLFKQPTQTKSGALAWLSYNTSGCGNPNVFAYKIDLVQEIMGPEIQTSGDYYTPSELQFWAPYNDTAFCQTADFIRGTAAGTGCQTDEVSVPPEQCIQSGSGFNQEIFYQDLSGYIDRVKNGIAANGELLSTPASFSSVSVGDYSYSYGIYKGVLLYNSPYSGDYIEITPYSYDYTGSYSGHYRVAPPYPAPTARVTCGVDYTTISGLATKLNETFSGSGYNLWNRDCVGGYSGIFETGGMLKAEVVSGDRILLTSLRAGPIGAYQFSLFEATRPESGSQKASGIRYLRPSALILEGSDNNTNWTGISREVIDWKNADIYSLVTTENSITTDSSGNPRIVSKASSPVSGVTIEPVQTLVARVSVTGVNKCGETEIKSFNYYVSDYCGETEQFPSEATGVSPTASGISNQVNPDGSEYTFNVARLGYKFASGRYNYYKLTLSGLQSQDKGQNIQLADSFYASSLTLFNVSTGAQLFSSETCLLGASYTGHVEGLTTGLLTGTITQNAISGRFSGSYDVTGTLTNVPLYRASGVATTPFTGTVNVNIAGTGYYVEQVGGYYYDTGSSCVSFTAPASGYITGSGYLTGGPYNVIKDSVIPTLTGNYQNVSGLATGMMTGTIYGKLFALSDVSSFAVYTSPITGNASGSITFSGDISTIPTTAYSVSISGTVQATGRLTYNTPITGDRIYVNQVPLLFGTGSGQNAPLYFSSQSLLTNILNSGSQYGVAATVNAGYIDLVSTYLGASGNSIPLSYSGAAGNISGPTGLSGGLDLHYPVTAFQPFTGSYSETLYATQYKTGLATGTVTGRVRQLDFIRAFTGVWGFRTGDVDFQSSGYISGARYQNSGFSSLPYYSGRPDYIGMGISFVNNPFVDTIDLARLTVTGYDVGTGLSVILSGQLT